MWFNTVNDRKKSISNNPWPNFIRLWVSSLTRRCPSNQSAYSKRAAYHKNYAVPEQGQQRQNLACTRILWLQSSHHKDKTRSRHNIGIIRNIHNLLNPHNPHNISITFKFVSSATGVARAKSVPTPAAAFVAVAARKTAPTTPSYTKVSGTVKVTVVAIEPTMTIFMGKKFHTAEKSPSNCWRKLLLQCRRYDNKLSKIRSLTFCNRSHTSFLSRFSQFMECYTIIFIVLPLRQELSPLLHHKLTSPGIVVRGFRSSIRADNESFAMDCVKAIWASHVLCSSSFRAATTEHGLICSNPTRHSVHMKFQIILLRLGEDKLQFE